MAVAQNRNLIKNQLLKNDSVTVSGLSSLLGISEVSIRKYLSQLERDGFCIRTHGGAVLVPEKSPVTQPLSKVKQAIAKTAASLIQPGARIIVDSGSTTARLLPFLQQIPDIVVMTNSLPIATALTERSNNATILMCGGTWDPVSHSFQGQMSEKMIASYNFEWAFVGASGVDVDTGTATFHELTKLSQVMSDVSEQTVVMAESDKLSKKMPNIELAWSQISHFVTDNQITEEAVAQIRTHDVHVLLADKGE
ncbi:DeoR/GlpR family DNA-binding transcription regulator [Alteromonas sp. LMIT006]|uniref:DeoR/GlpR family DNA-binding transcription regulator n=1 Tax=Alteromonadaceae TaxID=72275 RepID=UPI0020CA6224|nr:DeoR/GlpR family DNA-binding transcription regulator [Alteromonas sp. LMIT006]UTP73059.1 DeoR/GlpR family DNA-binding transcription regulator [Alteromonas sp. LMIT006]